MQLLPTAPRAARASPAAASSAAAAAERRDEWLCPECRLQSFNSMNVHTYATLPTVPFLLAHAPALPPSCRHPAPAPAPSHGRLLAMQDGRGQGISDNGHQWDWTTACRVGVHTATCYQPALCSSCDQGAAGLRRKAGKPGKAGQRAAAATKGPSLRRLGFVGPYVGAADAGA